MKRGKSNVEIQYNNGFEETDHLKNDARKEELGNEEFKERETRRRILVRINFEKFSKSFIISRDYVLHFVHLVIYRSGQAMFCCMLIGLSAGDWGNFKRLYLLNYLIYRFETSHIYVKFDAEFI